MTLNVSCFLELYFECSLFCLWLIEGRSLVFVSVAALILVLSSCFNLDLSFVFALCLQILYL